jgi:hypothetical protein
VCVSVKKEKDRVGEGKRSLYTHLDMGESLVPSEKMTVPGCHSGWTVSPSSNVFYSNCITGVGEGVVSSLPTDMWTSASSIRALTSGHMQMSGEVVLELCMSIAQGHSRFRFSLFPIGWVLVFRPPQYLSLPHRLTWMYLGRAAQKHAGMNYTPEL